MQINKCTHTTSSVYTYMGMYVFMHIYCKHTYTYWSKVCALLLFFYVFEISLLCSSNLHLIDQKYRQKQ